MRKGDETDKKNDMQILPDDSWYTPFCTYCNQRSIVLTPLCFSKSSFVLFFSSFRTLRFRKSYIPICNSNLTLLTSYLLVVHIDLHVWRWRSWSHLSCLCIQGSICFFFPVHSIESSWALGWEIFVQTSGRRQARPPKRWLNKRMKIKRHARVRFRVAGRWPIKGQTTWRRLFVHRHFYKHISFPVFGGKKSP